MHQLDRHIIARTWLTSKQVRCQVSKWRLKTFTVFAYNLHDFCCVFSVWRQHLAFKSCSGYSFFLSSSCFAQINVQKQCSSGIKSASCCVKVKLDVKSNMTIFFSEFPQLGLALFESNNEWGCVELLNSWVFTVCISEGSNTGFLSGIHKGIMLHGGVWKLVRIRGFLGSSTPCPSGLGLTCVW